MLNMSWNWLAKQWQDIRGNFKFWLTLIIGSAMVTAAVAITRGLEWWQQTILLVLFVMLFGWAVIASYLATRRQIHTSDVTTANVESYVRTWLDNFGVTTQKMPKSDQFHFGYLVTYSDAIPVYVFRVVSRDQYLTVQGTITVSKEHKEVFNKLSEAERKRFIHELRSEISRAKIHTKWTLPFEEVTVAKLLPITTVAEGELIKQMDEVHSNVLLVIDTINLLLEHGIQETKPGGLGP
jgi:hypothetical protein